MLLTQVVSIDGLDRLTLVGQGGFATVYSAYEPSLDRIVAVKVLSTSTEVGTARFLREVQLMGNLPGHPNIAPVYRSGVTDDGRAYLVMPYFEAGSLNDLVLNRGPLETKEVLRVGVKLAGALQTVHASGIVHGDVKPHNVLFTSYHEPVLTDFGVALELGASSAHAGLAFSPGFVAPEVVDGQQMTTASDVFSLALTIAAASGHRPWSSGEPIHEILERRLRGEQLSSAVDNALSAVLAPSLDRSPENRPTARELGEALVQLQEGRGEPTTLMLVIEPSRSTRSAGPSPGWPPPVPSSAGRVVSAPAAPATPVNGGVPPSPGSGGIDSDPSITGLPTTTVRTQSSVGDRRKSFTALMAPFAVVTGAFTRLGGRLIRWLRKGGRHLITSGKPSPAGPSGLPTMSALLADRPSPIDQLDVAPIVEALSRVLNDPGTALPLSVAMTGRWGSGKSSAMLQLERRLTTPTEQDRMWIPVWFDAWRFQGRDALWVGIARAIYRHGLAQQGSAVRRLRFRLRLARRRLGLPRMATYAAVSTLAASWIVASTVHGSSNSTWQMLTNVGAAVTGVVGAITIVKELGDPFRHLAGLLGRTPSPSGPTDRAEHDIGCLIATLTADGSALVLFLDDLDRCPAEVIRESLVCVAEVFGRGLGDRVVFVLGVDMDLVVSVVENELTPVRDALARVNPERSGLLGRHFVEKIFQLQVSLEGTRRLPTERLIGEASVDGVDPDRLWRFVQDLRFLPAGDAAEITMARHEHGMATGDVDRGDLLALRAAVRIRRSELLSSSADEVRRAETQVLAALRLTPRAVKRFDNTYRMQLQIAANTPGSEFRYDAADLLALAKWTALRLFFPTITAMVTAEIGLWEQLETAMTTKGAAGDVRRDLIALAPGAHEISNELVNLIGVGLPDASVRRLPLTSFADIV